MKEDFLFFVHDQVALLEILQNNMIQLKDALTESGSDSNDEEYGNIDVKLRERIESLIHENNSFILFLEEKYMLDDRYEYIKTFNESIKEYAISDAKINPMFIYDKLKRLEKVISSYKSEPIQNERFRKSQNQIRNIQRMLSMHFWQHSISLIQNLIDKSLDFTTLISEKKDVQELLPFDLIPCVETAIRNYQIKYDKKKIKIEREYEIEKLIVLGDRPSILRSFENIFHNCVKYNRTLKTHKVWITIKIFEKDNIAFVEFENWGVGIMKEELEMVFLSGYRGKLARANNIEGSGFGLTYAKREIENSNGEIIISSEPIDKPGRSEIDKDYITTTLVKLPKN